MVQDHFFKNEIIMSNLISLKVWDADIINPSPANGNKYVTNVTSVEVDNSKNIFSSSAIAAKKNNGQSSSSDNRREN